MTNLNRMLIKILDIGGKKIRNYMFHNFITPYPHTLAC